MDINEVIRITNLIKKVNCKSYALVSETAKELGVKKTALMQFIEDNPKLFTLVEVTEGKKNCGLGILTAYAEAVLNPATDEWLEAKKKEWEKKIHIGERNYYDCHEYWLIPEDNILYKEGEYRNTPEKIQELVDAGVIKKIRTCYGGWGDAWHEEVFIFNDEVRKAIEDYGWTTDFDEIAKEREK